VCEEKHMGSRAVVVACRDPDAAKARFGVATGEAGAVVTRTGRRFFTDTKIETELLDRLRAALGMSGFWDEHKTDWAVLDCELMPWSVKVQDLIRDQYAAVGAASRAALADVMPAMEAAAARGVDVGDLLPRTRDRTHLVGRYVEAYRRYCWPVRSLGRSQARTVPPARDRKRGPHRQEPRLAYAGAGEGLRRGPEDAPRHAVPGSGARRARGCE